MKKVRDTRVANKIMPNFLIVGAAKSATTSSHNYLSGYMIFDTVINNVGGCVVET